jgi:hypothetical protein
MSAENVVERPTLAGRAPARGLIVLGPLWPIVRAPVYALLAILEPVVTFLLAGIALLGIGLALLFRALHVPNYPFGFMMAMSIGCLLALVLYYRVMHWLR